MAKFTICIEETISEKFEVEASNAEEALDVGQAKYNSGEFVLAPGNLVAKQIAISDQEPSEWVEF